MKPTLILLLFSCAAWGQNKTDTSFHPMDGKSYKNLDSIKATLVGVFVSKADSYALWGQTDTIYFKYLYYQKCVLHIGEKGPDIKKYHIYTLSSSGGKYYLNGTPITKDKYDKLDSLHSNVCDSLYEKLSGKYFKFYTGDTLIKLEGRWYPEFWKGIYKEYYDNGILKTKGFYYDGDNIHECGNKVGTWCFYNRRGQLKKVIDYAKK